MQPPLSLQPVQAALRAVRGAAAAFLAPFAFAVLAGCGEPTLALAGGAGAEATFTSQALHGPVDARPGESPAPPVVYGGLTLQAAVVPVDTALEDGTMGLSIQVRARNHTGAPVRLPVRGCPVWPEFHDGPARSGAPAWVPGGHCMQEPSEVVLAPGEEKVFHFLAYDVMLAAGLEDGRYYVTARFGHADSTFRLDAGSADVRLRLPNMAYHVRVDEHAGGGLRARVRVENRNPGAVRLEFGACALGLELHREADLAGERMLLDDGRGCPAYLAIQRLAADHVLDAPEFQQRVPGRATRGVAPGTYTLAVTLRLNARTYRFPMGTVRVGG